MQEVQDVLNINNVSLKTRQVADFFFKNKPSRMIYFPNIQPELPLLQKYTITITTDCRVENHGQSCRILRRKFY